jgi:hypothetical protein
MIRKEEAFVNGAATSLNSFFILPALLLLCLIPGPPNQQSTVMADRHGTIHQLRIYEIFENNKEAFHARFRDHALRIMAKYHFRIVATWETRKNDRIEFVYLLEWPNRETMDDCWKRFLADPEWIEIKKVTRGIHGPLVGEIEDRALEPTDYSPGKTLYD